MIVSKFDGVDNVDRPSNVLGIASDVVNANLRLRRLYLDGLPALMRRTVCDTPKFGTSWTSQHLQAYSTTEPPQIFHLARPVG
jgi:hypothetical protein